MAVDLLTGKLTQEDYFESVTYLAIDQVDTNLGGGSIINRTRVFSVEVISCGKTGICFAINRNNLESFKLGPAGGDGVIQEFSPPGLPSHHYSNCSC